MFHVFMISCFDLHSDFLLFFSFWVVVVCLDVPDAALQSSKVYVSALQSCIRQTREKEGQDMENGDKHSRLGINKIKINQMV